MNVLRVTQNKAIKDETFFRLDVDKNFLSITSLLQAFQIWNVTR